MKALAKAGFTQSYTYFTWRNTNTELTEYLTELTQTAMTRIFSAELFHQHSGYPAADSCNRAARPRFKMRLVLAATLSPSYGIYSGFELCENAGVPGTEEYLNSEKYEIKVRDWNQPGNIREFIARVNADSPRESRAAGVSLILVSSQPIMIRILCYAKCSPDNGKHRLGRGESRSVISRIIAP